MRLFLAIGLTLLAVSLEAAGQTLPAPSNAVADGGNTYDDPALLGSLRVLREQGNSAKSANEPVTSAQLLSSPDDYRAKPVRMQLDVYRVEKMAIGEHLLPSEQWDASPIWRLDCVDALSAKPGEQAVVVFTPNEPTALMNQPARMLPGGVAEFDVPGRRVIVDGVFHKWFWAPSMGNQPRQYPLVLAWRVEPMYGRLSPADLAKVPGVLPVAVALLAAMGWLLFRALRASRRAALPGVSPRANQPLQQGDARAVDADLVSAVRRYEDERNASDAQDRTR